LAASRSRIEEAFRLAWTTPYTVEEALYAGSTIDGVGIRRYATLFPRVWKPLAQNATDEEIFLLGREVLKAFFHGRMGSELAALEQGVSPEAIRAVGRIAHRAAFGPRHPVLQALLRRSR